jgi:hypothetical protein
MSVFYRRMDTEKAADCHLALLRRSRLDNVDAFDLQPEGGRISTAFAGVTGFPPQYHIDGGLV